MATLRRQAGGLSYRQLARRAHYSATALSEAAGGEQLPSLAVTLAYVETCGGDRDEWEIRWQVIAAELASADEPDCGAQNKAEPDQDAPYLGLLVCIRGWCRARVSRLVAGVAGRAGPAGAR
ncbi:MAG: helix-turn-helix domain-containing protein [Egibacteraceae bacterium]